MAGDKLQQDICNWLSPPDPWKNHHIARASHHTGTAAWFTHGNTFSEWKSSPPSSLLWIHGKRGLPPGAYGFLDADSLSFRSGRRKEYTLVRLPSEITVFEPKVSASSTIIEEIKAMQKSGLASLAMFYYDFREDQKKDRRGLLSSVLVQLCRQSDSYHDVLSKFYLEHENGFQHASDDALARCLKDIVRLPGQAPIFLIVDALDECPNTSSLSSPRDNVLILVEDLVNSQLTNLRICVTSRPEADIKTVLEALTFRSVSLHDENGQKEDIENYIKWVVNTHRKMRRWKAEQRQLVIDMLTERADGM